MEGYGSETYGERIADLYDELCVAQSPQAAVATLDELAGLRLRERWGGWSREPFSAGSGQHVSVWSR